MKLAVIGGGSTYTPELVDGITGSDTLPITEVVLVDPDAHRLEVVGGLSARIMAAGGHPATVRATTDLDDGLAGAAAVLIQLRVGGQRARQRDETWPLDFGCVGQETTGAGGLAKALRTVPVVLDIADRAREIAAPDAWIIDFTNPVGIVTRALLDAGHRAVGLCNVAVGFQRLFAELLDVLPERVAVDQIGLNHLSWVRALRVDGTDALPALLATAAAEIAAAAELPASLIARLGAVPSSYLRYFYAHDAVVRELRAGPTRAEVVAGYERRLLEMYADPTLDHKPELLAQRGGAYYSEAAVALLAALVGDTGDVHVVNVRNNGAMPFLPDGAVVEVPSVIGAGGPAACPVGPVDPRLTGLIAHVSAYAHLAAAAARHGARDRVFDALLAHPLIGQLELAASLTDRLIAENRAYLGWVDR
jgi:6-phospho-beta-glucosidase